VTCMRQCPSGIADLGSHWDHTVCDAERSAHLCTSRMPKQIGGNLRRRLVATFWGSSVGSGGRRPTKRTPRRPPTCCTVITRIGRSQSSPRGLEA
jgi:hypothetical protein